jgi:SpoVK/Ycf46/Vps4 family AAA+-type ATPase
LHFHGPAGTGRRRAAEALARSLTAPLLAVDLGLALARAEPWGRTLAALFRQARLDGALLYLDGIDALDGEERRRERRALLGMAAEGGVVVILAGQRTPGRDTAGAVAVSFEVARFEGRHAQWREALAAAGIGSEPAEINALAGQFRLTADQIADAVAAARGRALWRGALAAGPGAAPGSADLFAAARAQSSHDLLGLARPIEPKHSWADIVLPSDRLAQLHEICARATLRHVVYDRWGFEKKLSTGRGLTALFSGPSGTGKTMAAEIIAGELGLELHKIDLSQIVSKYIGETEKNLDRIFQAAENANAILFFDEADALFGKRSEVKDAHDRYANIEVGYLLQKMDEYEGIAILATNLRQNMDEAFIRRLHVVVEFPFPGEADRRRIWAAIFPPEAPLAPAVDFDRLAREVRLSGGKIRNIAVAAAFQAASGNGVIGMSELVEAARREYEKAGQTWQPTASAC